MLKNKIKKNIFFLKKKQSIVFLISNLRGGEHRINFLV